MDFKKKKNHNKNQKNQNKNQKKKSQKKKDDFKEFINYIENESKEINYDLFHLFCLVFWQNKFYETKNKKDNELVELIKVRWSNLKDVIEKMSEDEIKIKKTKY